MREPAKLAIDHFIGNEMPNVVLHIVVLSESLGLDAVFHVDAIVSVVKMRPIEIDAASDAGKSIGGPKWLQAVRTKPGDIAMIYENLYRPVGILVLVHS